MFEKARTTIYLDLDVKKDMKDKHVNVSEWINTEYRHQFLSVDSTVKRLSELDKEKIQLESSLEGIKQKESELFNCLTTRETQYINTINSKLRNGANWTSVLTFFNNEFHRNYTLAQLKAIEKFYQQESVWRMKHALDKKKDKKSSKLEYQQHVIDRRRVKNISSTNQ